jgi:hypothetical protein
LYNLLPYIALTKEQKQFCFEKSVEASVALEKWSVTIFGNRKSRQFRNDIFKNKMTNIPAEYQNNEEFKKDLQSILFVHKTPCAELDGNTVETAILFGYSRFIQKVSAKWANQLSNNGAISKQDIYQEVTMKMLDCIYGYRNPKIKFITYCWWALQRSIFTLINKSNGFRPLKNDDAALVREYKNIIDDNENLNFDQVIEKMGLNDKKRKKLIFALAKVQYTNELSSMNGDEIEDYTGLRSDIDQINTGHEAKIELQDILSKVNLSEIEKEILAASFSAYHGWQTDFAKSKVDPMTNKCRSSAWVWMKYNSALKKLKKAVAA